MIFGLPGAASSEEPAAGARPLNLFDLGAPTFSIFTARDGVPESPIVSLANDAEGFVWLASSQGLARFDGTRWEPMPSGFVGEPMDLFLGHDGTQWVSLYDNGLAHSDGNGWRLENRATGLPTDHFRRVRETRDAAGRVETWALTYDAGILRRVNGRWQSEPGNDQLPPELLIAIARTHEIGGRDRLWVATVDSGIWYRDDGGSWARFRAPGFAPTQVEDLLVTHSGGREELWIAAFGVGLWRLTEAGLTGWTQETGDLRSNLLYRLAVTRLPGGDRAVWAATRDGLVRVHGDKAQVFDRRHGLPSNVIRDLHVWQSPSGTDVLWIGTETGLARTLPGATPWQTASLTGSGGIGVFGELVEPDGRGGERLWVASSQDGLCLFQDGQWKMFNSANGRLPATHLRMVRRVPDAFGRSELWISLWGGELDRVGEGPRFRPFPTPWPKQDGEVVMDLLARTVGGRYELWAATRGSGLYRWRAGKWTAFRPGGVVGRWSAIKLLEQVDREGKSWLWATTNQGLARFDGSNWSLLAAESGLPDVALAGLSMIPDRAGRPVLWVGSFHSGIIRIDVSDPRRPRVLPAGEIPKAPDPTAYGALQDSRGRIYVATNNGVQLLVPVHSGGYRERLFGRRDGMVHQECNANGQRIDAHGRYWTGTLGGLAVYDPSEELPDRSRKPLRWTHVLIDGQEVSRTSVKVPPRAREVLFDFALLAWQRESESRFRTQLLGYDPVPGPWVPQNYRLFGTLPPGRFRLVVEARDYAGNATAPLEIPIEVLPAWWQQQWLRIFGVAIFALVGPLFYLNRTRRLSRQKAGLALLVQSRTAELAQANERLEVLSREDSLTGVANRRRLDEALEEEWRRAARRRAPLSFLLLDVDHFKAYNDHLGHPAGDVCLKAIARVVADAHTRAGELVARYGGEEFAVLIPGVDREAAVASAETVRRRVLDLALPHPSSGAGSWVTVSVGVASAEPSDGSSAANLVSEADRALYRAKREGRNCVRCAEDE